MNKANTFQIQLEAQNNFITITNKEQIFDTLHVIKETKLCQQQECHPDPMPTIPRAPASGSN